MFKIISSGSTITGLTVSCNSNSLYPSFDPSITDYCIETGQAIDSSLSYTIAVNNVSLTAPELNANDYLLITDGVKSYYIRFLPQGVEPIAVSYSPTVNYVEGYYTDANIAGFGGDGNYYNVFDHNGVPVWYISNSTMPTSLHRGLSSNRVVLNSDNPTPTKTVIQISNDYLDAKDYNLANYAWHFDQHDVQEISLPLSISGNIISFSYTDGTTNGFYIQEQDKDSNVVWDWFSNDYFTDTVAEVYHLNSIDVHPISRDILISARDTSSVFCIDYTTKELKWNLQGNVPMGTIPYASNPRKLQTVANSLSTVNTKWLDRDYGTIIGEPYYNGYQYSGANGQHDARWHTDIDPLTAGNVVISIYDNQSHGDYSPADPPYAGPNARGVIYEIDPVNGVAYHRSSIFSDDRVTPSNPTSPYIGSYTIIKEEDNTYSHAINFPTSNPEMVEYRGSVDGVNNHVRKVLSFDTRHDGTNNRNYRIIKFPKSFLDIEFLRHTAGQPLNTLITPLSVGPVYNILPPENKTKLITNYVPTTLVTNGLLLNLDAATYSGSGNWVDSVSGLEFYFENDTVWSAENGGIFKFGASANNSWAFGPNLGVSLSSYTINTWFKINNFVAGIPCIVCETFAHGVINYAIEVRNPGVIFCGYYPGYWDGLYSTGYQTDTWYNLTMVVSGTDVFTYVNGALSAQGAAGGLAFSVGDAIRIGARWDSDEELIDGAIPVINIYDRPLTEGEIKQNFSHYKDRYLPPSALSIPNTKIISRKILGQTSNVKFITKKI